MATDNGGIKELKKSLTALKEFSLCLDRVYKRLPYWSHLAGVLNIDSCVISQCGLYMEKSPTIKLFEYLSARMPELTIRDLKDALIEIQRVDIYDMISEKRFKDEDKVSVVITDSCSDIMDDIALELDAARRPIGNWEKLAQKLGVPHDISQKFAMYSDYNPTVALVKYLYSTRKKPILLKDFMDRFSKMGREDVLDKIKESIDVEDNKDFNANIILKVGSKLLQEIAVLLNKDIAGVEGWRELGSHFNVDTSIMDSLEPPHDKEVYSPTTELINYLAAARPSTTINDIAEALEKIERYDALNILKSYFDVDIAPNLPDGILKIDVNAAAESVDRTCSTPITKAPFGIQAIEQEETKESKRDFGIPSQTIDMIGRDNDKKELIDSLKNDQYQMIVMHGSPGYGKTTLVVNVAHDIIKDPHCYSVVYVDSKDVFSSRDLACKILTTRGIPPSENCPKSQVIKLFSCLKQGFVLILENLDHMYHSTNTMNETYTSQACSTSEEFPCSKSDVSSKKKEEFQCFLRKLVQSAPKLKILVTTWETVAFVTFNVKPMKLSLLEEEDSLKLLRSRIDKPLRSDDEKALDTIIKCCGGIPLLLCAAVVLITEYDSVKAFAKILSSRTPYKWLEILSPDSLPVDKRLACCLEICFERMSKDSRELLVLLSVFPNPFTLKEAQQIAEGSEIDENQIDKGFQLLRKFCFLNTYVESEKCILHSSIRSFGILKASQEEEQDLKTVYKEARRRFINCTFKILSEIEAEFFSTHSKSAIEKYRLQDENIREIARWCITESSIDVKDKQLCVQSFIDSQSVLLKLMRSHPLKLILNNFCQLCKNNTKLAQLYCECMILAGAKIVIGCLSTHLWSTALKEAMSYFLDAFKVLKAGSSEECKEQTISDLVSFDVPQVIMESDAISEQAKARFLIKGGKCLVRQGHKDVGFHYIQNGIEVRSQCYKSFPSSKCHVMLAVGWNDFAAAHTFVEQHKDAVSVRKQEVLPIYMKELGIHPFTATAHSQLARNYLELGDYDKAVEANETALEYRETLLGDHQDTARSLFDKGDILSQQASMSSEPITEKYEEALKYFEKALQMQQQVLDSPEETCKTLEKMVDVLNVLGRTAEKERRLQQMSEYEKKTSPGLSDIM